MAVGKLNISKRKLVNKAIVALVALVIIVGPTVFGVIYYKKYQNLNKLSTDQFSKRDNARLLGQIKKVYNLPTNEEPSTIATVSDKEALKKQYPFFNEAENGDVVLIYTKAQLALIYRPATKQVVKSGPINTQSSIRIKVIGDASARAAIENTLTDNKVTSTDAGAGSGIYAGVTVVDVSGKSADQAKTLAGLVKGTVGQLPAGETAPADTDLLVIVGPVATP